MAHDFGVSQIDKASGAIMSTLPLGPRASLAAVGNVLLVASYTDGTLAQLDPATGELTAETDVDCPAALAVVSELEAWVVSPCVARVARVGLGDGVTAQVEVADAGAIALGGGAVWVAGRQSVLRVDEQTLETASVLLPGRSQPVGIAYGEADGGVWVAAGQDRGMDVVGGLFRIDPQSLEVTRADGDSYALRLPPEDIAIDGRDPWVVGVVPEGNFLEVRRVLARVDAATLRLAEQYVVPPAALVLHVDSRRIWLAAGYNEIIAVAPEEGTDEAPAVPDEVTLGGLRMERRHHAGEVPVYAYAPVEGSATRLPVFVLIGGGPTPPSELGHMSPLGSALASTGAVVFVAGYRSIATGHHWRQAVTDARCAVAFARDQAGDYGGNPRNIVLVGFSYGGETALLATLSEAAPSEDCPVAGDGLPDAVVSLAGFPLRPGDVRQNIAALLISGSEDDAARRGEQLTEKMRELGLDASYVELPGIDHPGVIDPASPVIELLIDFAGR